MMQIHQKRSAKASVFEDLFSDKNYLLELYQALHPEDTETTINDLKNVTLNNVLTTSIYNDLGFTVGSRLIILVEAQSTWTVNIIPRAILYLAESWHRYFISGKLNIYGATPIKIPKPELYVIYTGKKEIAAESISLAEEFFDGEEIALDARIKVLKDSADENIIGQYIAFCKILDGQRARYPEDQLKAVQETIRLCSDANILKKYLEVRKKEVTDIMMYIFDQETATRLAIEDETRRATKIATKKAMDEGMEKGIEEGQKEGAETKAREIAKNLYAMGLSINNIVKGVGYPPDTIKRWLNIIPS